MRDNTQLSCPGAGEHYPDQITCAGKASGCGPANFNNSGDPATGRSQKAVDAFFHDQSRYWKDVYQTDSLSAVIYRERRAAVLSMVDKLRLPVWSRILEVGCGAGSTSIALAQRGYRVTAVDTVEGMLELTRQAAAHAGLGANLEVSSADICQLSFPSRHFALAVAVGVFPWLEHPLEGLRELNRVVKSGGYVIVTVTNKWCLHQILDPMCFPALQPMRWRVAEALEKLNLWRRPRPRQYRYSVKQIDIFLSQTGLRKLAGKTLGFGPFTMFKQNLLPNTGGVKLHHRIQALADRDFPVIQSGGAVYVVLAQKP